MLLLLGWLAVMELCRGSHDHVYIDHMFTYGCALLLYTGLFEGRKFHKCPLLPFIALYQMLNRPTINNHKEYNGMLLKTT